MKRRSVLVAAVATPFCSFAAQDTPRVPNISVLDQQGRAWRLRELMADRTVAINFIYTGCASFCPPQTAVFRAVQTRLSEFSHEANKPLLLSITLDPLNDTPQALTQYAARFEARLGADKGWLMLTGEPAAMEQATRAFGASSVRVEDHPAQLWAGCVAKSRWLKSAGLATADDVLRMMKAVSA